METPVIIHPSKGFTINMFNVPVKNANPDAITKDYVKYHNAKTRKFVESNYDTGYVFGAFAAVGLTNLFPEKGGMTVFYIGTKDPSKLMECLKREFLVTPKHYKVSETQHTVNVHSAAFSRVMVPFGKRHERTVPPQYMVDNESYLRGVRDGIVYYEGHIQDTRKVVKYNRAFNPRNANIVKTIEKHLGIDGQ